MKKCITIILVLLMVFNALIPNYIYAGDTYKQNMVDVEGGSGGAGYSGFNSLADEGTAQYGANGSGGSEEVTEVPNVGGAVANILVLLFFLPVYVVRVILSLVSVESFATEGFRWFYIEDLVFGNIPLTDNNFFDISGSGVNAIIKEAVIEWYATIMLLAIIANLAILVYIGIRMATSTLSNKRARYKKMLINWFVGFILLFILHYIMVLFMSLSNGIVALLNEIPRSAAGFEEDIFQSLWDAILGFNGWRIVGQFIIYVILVYYQVKFFILYIKRLLSTGFLIIIAPLITITYAIDKVGDDQSQALITWFKEFTINVFIQPLHAFLYLLFMFSASEIMKEAPLLAAVFLMGMTRAERVIKDVFRMRGATSIHSISPAKGGKKG